MIKQDREGSRTIITSVDLWQGGAQAAQRLVCIIAYNAFKKKQPKNADEKKEQSVLQQSYEAYKNMTPGQKDHFLDTWNKDKQKIGLNRNAEFEKSHESGDLF